MVPYWVTLLVTLAVSIAIVIGAASLIIVFVWFRPQRVSELRINVVWIATLVSVLTLTFGLKLIEELARPDAQSGSNTIEIVLSSLVGVGIGGLIAIAAQLVQDSSGTNDPQGQETSTTGQRPAPQAESREG